MLLGYLLAILGLFRSVILTISGRYIVERPETRVLDHFKTTSEKLSDAMALLQEAHEELQWLPNNLLHTDARPRVGRR